MANQQPFKVGILSVTQGEGGGAEVVLERLLQNWGRSDGLFIIAPTGSRIISAAREIKLRCAELETDRDAILSNLNAFRKVLPRIGNFNVVHAWTARAFDLAWWLGSQWRVPCSGTLHDHPQAVYHSRLRQRNIRFFANRFSTLVCVSHAVHKACTLANYRCTLEVIHNGLLYNNVPKKSSPFVRIGFLGMHALFKGFPIIETWIRNVGLNNIHWHLYGEMAPELQRSAERLIHDYPNQVFYLGRQKTEYILAEIDILVHASTEFDSLPTVLMEAAHAGVPSIASSLGGAPEIVEDRSTGFLFDPNTPELGLEYLHALVNDEMLRAKIGKAARQRAREYFDILAMIDRYAALWQRISLDRGESYR